MLIHSGRSGLGPRLVPSLLVGDSPAGRAGPVAVAGDRDLMGVVGKSVEGGAREERLPEHLGPLGEGAVRGLGGRMKSGQ